MITVKGNGYTSVSAYVHSQNFQNYFKIHECLAKSFPKFVFSKVLEN